MNLVEQAVSNWLRFKIPGQPPSVNALYSVNHVQRKVTLKPEVLFYKSKGKMYIPRWDAPANVFLNQAKLVIRIFIHADWYHKNGEFRTIDSNNMLKVIKDMISERLGFNDKCFWQEWTEKVQDVNWEGIYVELGTIEEQSIAG